MPGYKNIFLKHYVYLPIGKTLSITRGLTSQQLLLLRQTTLHPHQTVTTAPSSQTIQSLGSQTQPNIMQQKLTIPSGIEQLRATVASAASVLPRFTGIAATSGTGVKGLTSGRTLQTEEVLALLKQQSMRMAATQSYKAASVTVTTGAATSVAGQHNVSSISTVAAQNLKAQIQALAAQQKAATLQMRPPSEKE